MTLGKEKYWFAVMMIFSGFITIGGLIDNQVIQFIGIVPLFIGGPIFAIIRWFEIQDKYKHLK